MFKELLGDALPVVEKFAPVMAHALISHIGPFSGMFALNLISNALGVPINNLSQAILTHPDAQDKLANLETQFSDWFKGMNNFKMPDHIEINLKLDWNQTQN